MKRFGVPILIVVALVLTILPHTALGSPLNAPPKGSGGQSAFVYVGAFCTGGKVHISGIVVVGSGVKSQSPRFTINATVNGQPAPWYSKSLRLSVTPFHYTFTAKGYVEYLYEVLTAVGTKAEGGGHLTCSR